MRCGLCAVVVASLLVGACDAALGIEPLPRSRATTSYVAVECGRCVDVSCAGERATCRGDQACLTLQDCLAQCVPDDARCRMDCETKSPLAAGSPAFTKLDRCLRASCAEPCLGVGGLETLFGDRCKCLSGACAAESTACVRAGSDAHPGGCERRFACIARDGVDSDNVERCLTEDTSVTAEVNALRACYRSFTCKGCPLGADGDLECVDEYVWSQTRAKTVKLTFRFTTFDDRRLPVPEITAKACNYGTCDACTTPLVPARQSDAAGEVSLDVPSGLGGFGGCVRFDKPGLIPMIYQAGHPVARDARGELFVVTDAGLPFLGTLAGTTVLPERGHLLAIQLDCMDMPVRGVTLSVTPTSPETRRGYYVGGRLDTTVTETGILGSAFFVNLPVGDMVSTVLGHVGTAEVSRSRAQIAPGTISIVVNYPRVAQ